MLDLKTRRFYERILTELVRRELRFMIGGAYALRHHTGIVRETKDLDLFVMRTDIEPILAGLRDAGFNTELTYTHWLGKVYDGDEFVDVIFSSGNGVAQVDEDFFAHAQDGMLFGVPVKWCPPEEMIWSKAFVMERERYDGADVAHIIHVCGERLDWDRILVRFGSHWRVLLSHLVLFGFIYPQDHSSIPGWIVHELTRRLRLETHADPRAGIGEPVCGGTLLSRSQFLVDVHDWGYVDGRLAMGAMNESEIAQWTAAIRAEP